MRTHIFYFSGTGNTYWAVKKLCSFDEGFTYSSIEDSIEVQSVIEACDAVGFAYPIYGSDIPQLMKDFMKRCYVAKQKKTIILVTQWMFSGDGSTTSREFLHPNFEITHTIHLKMPNNISITKFRWLFQYTNDPRKIQKKLSLAEKKLKRFYQVIKDETRKVVGDNKFSIWLGNIQKKPFRKYYDRFLNDISFDPTRCTNCNVCVQLCPVRNIEPGEMMPHAKGECILCLRCYNYCPTSAVKYMEVAHLLRRGEPYRCIDPSFLKERLNRRKSSKI